MFDLKELPESVLDCCAGGASFTAEAAARGVDAVAVDPAYELEPAQLVDVVRRSLPATAGIVNEHEGRFVWHWYGTPERKDQFRIEAADRFLQDVAAAPERYVATGLPELPFGDRRFELVLCSHLLFTWADKYDEDPKRRVVRGGSCCSYFVGPRAANRNAWAPQHRDADLGFRCAR